MSDDETAAEEPRHDSADAAEEGVNGAPGDDSGDESAETIESLRLKAQANWEKYLRTVAEIENLRKRNARDVENARRYGVESLVASILPVRDSLEAALKAADEADDAAVDVGSLVEGDKATLRLLNQALESAGIAEIDPEGEPFDPEQHEAMSMLPSPTAEPNSVINVVQKGFVLHGRIVRPARVIVACAPPSADSGDSADD